MKVGVFQFRGSGNISDNHEAIKRAITSAAQKKVRLLVFQECAACGYPPVETSSIEKINFENLDLCFQEIKQLAKKHCIYIALGTIRKQNSKYFNSIQLIDPNGELVGNYDKRALWGWDLDNFINGFGIYQIDDIKVGFRICFEVRFPEYFRELFKSNVQLCFVSFCDVSEKDSIERYNIIKAHLITRAVENTMTIVSVNSISKYQTAPTAVIDLNGNIVDEAPRNQEYLLVYDYNVPAIDFGAEGRIKQSLKLLGEGNGGKI
ncbi:MAG TPA: carbon-nitrogen hydrolase family protein [Clostridia bacterium]